MIRGVSMRAGLLFLALATYGPVLQPAAAQSGTVTARLEALEAREAIRQLWADYGRTLDNRDFKAFAQLFAREGEFVGGPGATAKGRDAVGALLEKLLTTNFPNSRGRNMHFYVNESIDVRGGEASAVTRGGFLVANASNRPEISIMATYKDDFVREDGQWKFKRREVIGDIPVPRSAAPTGDAR
jgi:uncharacterized protein (TIGR02246 family)